MDKTQTEKKKAKLSDSFGGTVEQVIPPDAEWIDDAFYIKKTRFGLYTSIHRNHSDSTSLLVLPMNQF